MAEPAERPTRRRRRRGTSEQGPPPAHQATGDDAPKRDGAPKRPARKARTDPDERDRGMRALVGAGPSQLGVEGALRGRDVNRPTEADLAEAERDVVIVRRHWTPPQ
jgi:hypothetical protein